MKYDKLVRDKIPGILENLGIGYHAHIADSPAFDKYLMKKMEEELLEFTENPSVEEAADMYEVYLTILDNWKLDLSDVIAFAAEKRELKGGFKCGIILNETLRPEEGHDRSN